MNCTNHSCGNFENEIQNLSVLLIDEDKQALKQLERLLIDGGIHSIATISSESDISNTIKKTNPDLIFIDEEIVKNSATKIISQVHVVSCEASVIITSKSRRKIDLGIGFNNIPILSKPVSFAAVNNSVSILIRDRVIMKLQSKINRLFNNVCPVKLKFSTRKGHVFIDPEEIVYFKADSNYTHIYLKSKKQITVAKSLRHFDEGLKNSYFVRISRSVIINTTFLTELDRHKKACLLKYDEDMISLPITKNYISPLLQGFMQC